MDKRFLKACACIGLALTVLTGCGDSGDTVPVQTVSSITGHGNVGYVNRFAGVVVAGNTNDIYLQSGMTVDKMNVETGDEVKVGDVLFTYDTDYMELTITQAELEIEGLKNTIETAKNQISELEKNMAYASEANKVTYTLEIQSLQMQIKENEYNINMKQAALDRQKEALKDTAVKSSVNGTVTAVNAKDATDNYGNPLPFIVITEAGNMRIKATVNELNIGQVYSGASVTILSRTAADAQWTGYISTVDYDNPENSNNNNFYYGPTDEYTSSSKYPFYVVIDDVDGLMMGQHVYIQMGETEQGDDILRLPEFYINDAATSPWVWAANSRDKLEKRHVTLGEYDEFTGQYVILSGLTFEDAITADMDGLKEGKRVTIYDGSDYIPEGDIGYYETDEWAGFVDDDMDFDQMVTDDGIFSDILTDEFGDGSVSTGFIPEAAPGFDVAGTDSEPFSAPAAVTATDLHSDGKASGSDIGG